jgi:hypothetical protein
MHRVDANESRDAVAFVHQSAFGNDVRSRMFTPKGPLGRGICLAAAQQKGRGTGTDEPIASAMIHAARNAECQPAGPAPMLAMPALRNPRSAHANPARRDAASAPAAATLAGADRDAYGKAADRRLASSRSQVAAMCLGLAVLRQDDTVDARWRALWRASPPPFLPWTET